MYKEHEVLRRVISQDPFYKCQDNRVRFNLKKSTRIYSTPRMEIES